MGNKRWRKRKESLLGLIRVIIGGQSMKRQLEGVDLTWKVVDGEGGDGGVRGRRVVGTILPHTRGMLGNGGWLSLQT